MSESPIDDLLASTVGPDDPTTLPLLRTGEIEVLGRMPFSSNAIFLVTVDDGTDRTQAIYKPEAGEQPLWDFPAGIWAREVATYELAAFLGWPVVPPTVTRTDGPVGPGSLQFYVPAHYDEHYFSLRDRPEFRTPFHQICALDVVANNTDRKGGHTLLGRDGRIWGIDNALCFHAEFKLRTVLWDFADQPLPDTVVEGLHRLIDDGLPDSVAELLDPFERDATLTRTRALLNAGRFPNDPTGQRHPWPLI